MTTTLPDALMAPLVESFGADRLAQALAALRPAEELLTAEALGSVKATGLSFARSLVARMVRERWRIRLREIEVDASGVGHAVYDIDADGHAMTFAAFSQNEEVEEKEGRLCDSYFDGIGVLFQGTTPMQRILAEREQTKFLWAGRTDNSVLGWTVTNRSDRFFDAAVAALAVGRQPDAGQLATGGGYILRNAGFYGNGRMGCAVWRGLDKDHPLIHPYHQEMFGLYLWRGFGFDLAEAVARHRNPNAATLDAGLKRFLGIGNASGLGMVAIITRWPLWLATWVLVRELALAFAVTDPGPVPGDVVARFRELLVRARHYYRTVDARPLEHVEPRDKVAANLDQVAAWVDADGTNWANVMDRAAAEFDRETVEQVASLLIDCYPARAALIDRLTPIGMNLAFDVMPEQTVADLAGMVRRRYAWALDMDLAAAEARRYFWYRSEEHNEQRRGERGVDPGEPVESFVDVAGAAQALLADLERASSDTRVGRFLFDHPAHRYMVARVQSTAALPYAEIHTNLIDAEFLPVRIIRFYLTTMGLESAAPKNFRWVRGVLMQGAPLPEELEAGAGADWTFPVQPDSSDPPASPRRRAS